jgi:L-threonate 2-dehydrogenase
MRNDPLPLPPTSRSSADATKTRQRKRERRMTTTVGIIGLGIMGGAMARNMVKSGIQVFGYDIEPGAIIIARNAGVEIVTDVAALTVKTSDILVSLPSVKAVMATAAALAATKAKRLTVAETSTLSLDDKLAFQKILTDAGHTVLDCPLSGTGSQAQTKDLVIYASGDDAAIKRLDPVFLGFGRKVQNLGAFGNGTKMKLVANLLVAIHNVAASEAMVLGMKAGLDPKQIVEVISSGAGTSRVFELRAPMMAANNYLPATMRSRTWKKDMTVIGNFASDLDCPTPLFSLTGALYDAALAMGRDAEDVGAVCSVLEVMAGLKRPVGKV